MAAAFPVAQTIEDLEFLDQTLVGATEAAKRTGFASAEGMEKWLERHDAYDLWLSFKGREARGTHSEAKRRMSAVPNDRPDPIIAVLDAADDSSRAATRRKAEKVRTLLAELRESIATEAADADRKVAAKAEIERLTKALAEAKANLRGGPASLAVGDSVSAADLRKWAAENGVECPSMGRVPTAVREAYEASDDAEAAS